MDAATQRAVRLQQVTGRLLRRMRAETGELAGMSTTQDWALAILVDTPMSGAELARTQSVRPQTMSTAIAGLEQAGYVRRESDPGDGRRILLHPTDAGRVAYERALDGKRRWLQGLLAEFEAADLRALDVGLDILERIADV